MDEDDLTPRAVEAGPVVLARMEGKLDRINDRVADLIPRVGKIEDRTKALEDVTLTLTKNAEAEEAKKIALALALKEAEDNRRTQNEQSWTPFQRLMTVIACIVGVAGLFILFYTTVHH
jgi:hypothetical protein